MTTDFITAENNLTREQASALLGFSITTLRRLEEKGLLCPVKLTPSKVRYSAAEIARYKDTINMKHQTINTN